ncbi:MAG: transketolase C-terminal domain-containing protein [Bacillota bacterium]|nr:transketolase C-terminal domain-containing protein [Bacillota bacterium]
MTEMGPSTREAYGQALLQLGRQDPRIVVLDGDLSTSTMTRYFAKEFPQRFFNMGIAEANMVGAAAGLSRSGKIPFISSFATFLMSKGYDQMRMAIAYSKANVKLVGSHGGISVGEDGVSQQSVEDLALARSLPGFYVACPADGPSTAAVIRAAAYHPGPVYVRVGRPPAPLVYREPAAFAFGRAPVLRQGRDVTIAALGLMVPEALKAADMLAEKGYEARVLDLVSVKPLDTHTLIQAAEETGAMVVAEEHLLAGGVGSAVAMLLSQFRPIPLAFVGMEDTYAESGKPAELFQKYGLTAENIAWKAEALITRYRRR